MAFWSYVVSDTNTGTPIANVPIRDVAYSRRLTDIGTLTASIPLEDPKATRAIWGDPDAGGTDRDLTVFRDGVPDFSGPVTTFTPQRSQELFQITAREITWHYQKRYLEISRNFNADLFYIVRAIHTDVTTKAGTNGSLPHFTVTAGSAGYTRTAYWYGPARWMSLDKMKELAADPVNGYDWRVDYTAINGLTASKVLTLGYPSLGSTVTSTQVTDKNVLDYGRSPDRERAATRVHVIGAYYVKTLQNTGAVTAGEALVEGRYDHTGISSSSQIDRLATEYRRLAQPPVNSFWTEHRPGGSLPWGFCNLGDKVSLDLANGPDILVSSAARRVIEIGVTPESDTSDERVRLTYNLPLDQLGA